MILIIGGAYQGKLDYAKTLSAYKGAVLDGAMADKKSFIAAACVNHLHLFVKNSLQSGSTAAQINDFVLSNSADKIIICDDICGGIIPIDKFETLWRETTGRLLCELTKRADVVIRMQSALPQVLKGAVEYPC